VKKNPEFPLMKLEIAGKNSSGISEGFRTGTPPTSCGGDRRVLKVSKESGMITRRNYANSSIHRSERLVRTIVEDSRKTLKNLRWNNQELCDSIGL